mmetsp:Transcript_6750/g.13037  ORF Transcript_6750/g.13037 Transcript_6750/m.13037 type:complete len:645 (+) Transcript_6750:109-2043(+)
MSASSTAAKFRYASTRLFSTFTTRQAAMARRSAVAISLARKKPPKKTAPKLKRKGVVRFSPLSSRIATAVYVDQEAKEYDDAGLVIEDTTPPTSFPLDGGIPPASSSSEACVAQGLDFDDASVALKSKTTGELLRATIVLQLCRLPPLVAYGRRMYALACKVLGQKVTDVAVKATFFGHFCGGESEAELKPLLQRMKALGVGGILDYAAENDVPEADKDERGEGVVSARTFDYVNEKMCDANAEMVERAIEAASRAMEGGEGRTQFAAMKLTAFGQPALLERTSRVIQALQVAFAQLDTKHVGTLTVSEVREGFKLMGVSLSPDELEALLDTMDKDKNGTIDSTEFLDTLSPLDPASAPLFTQAITPLFVKSDEHLEALEADEILQLNSMNKRLKRVAQKASDMGVSLMIDAEQTYMQPAIDQVALSLMREYNTDRAVILNTYQCYLRDSFQRVRTDIDRSEFYSFVFGAKIVRGAYMVQERRRAEEMGYPDPIQPDLESTHRNYDAVAAFILSHKVSLSSGAPPTELTEAEKKTRRRRSKTLLMVASHNENSVLSTVGLMSSMGLAKDSGVCFGQLRGMCDHVSLSLGSNGFWVYKYLPYGPVKEVMPYLLRRAEENSTLMAGAGKERGLLARELRSRMGLGA